MVKTIRDKILNHLVSLYQWDGCSRQAPFPGQAMLDCTGYGIMNVADDDDFQGADEVPLVVVGNKSDLKTELRQVSLEEGRQLAEEVNCAFTEASAFLDFNVSKAFELMIGEIEKSQNPGQPAGNNKCAVM
jgi:GTPase SAR1 family protein